MADFQSRVEILERSLDRTIQADFVNSTLLCVESDVLEVVFLWQNCQLHEADDAPRGEVDAGQGDDLVNRARRKRKRKISNKIDQRTEMTWNDTYNLKGR